MNWILAVLGVPVGILLFELGLETREKAETKIIWNLGPTFSSAIRNFMSYNYADRYFLCNISDGHSGWLICFQLDLHHICNHIKESVKCHTVNVISADTSSMCPM